MKAKLSIPAVTLIVLTAACGGRTAVTVPERRAAPASSQLSELWVDPGAGTRDLFLGVGGERHAPPPDATYVMKAKDESGFSVGYDVTGPDGTEWSAKIGPEAQAEVAVSRILWGLGYHQPPVYYLPSWKLAVEGAEPRTESEARFRPKIAMLERLEEPWRWADNPFIDTPQLRGLLVILLMLNSTDLKDDNNSVYQLSEPWDGATRWFVVRDVGASLGETGRLHPRRNWIEGFEKQAFITGVEAGRVRFDYDGVNEELTSLIRPEDVRWAAALMDRLTDTQWRDAFRAAGYDEPATARYVRRLRQKIDDGKALRVDSMVKDR